MEVTLTVKRDNCENWLTSEHFCHMLAECELVLVDCQACSGKDIMEEYIACKPVQLRYSMEVHC